MDNQDLAILHEIIFRKEKNIEHLRHKFSMSKRQILYSIKKVNELLHENFQQTIVTSGKIILVPIQSEIFLQNYLLKSNIFDDIYYSKKNRQMLLFLILSYSQEYLSLDYLIIILETSRSTVLKDLKELKNKLVRQGLGIHYSRKKGYNLTGNEELIRFEVMQTVLSCLYEDNGELMLENFLYKSLEIDTLVFKQKIMKASEKFQIQFFENKLKEFTYCFILLNRRLKYTTVDFKEMRELFNQQSEEYKACKYICDFFEIKDPKNIKYIYVWLLGVSSGNFSKETSDKEIIEQVVRQLVSRFESLSGIKFLEPEFIIQRLYEHIRPAYYRILYRLPIYNPLSIKIQNEYSEMYYLVKESLKPLQSVFKNELPTDEIAFLTVHFAASLYEVQEEHDKGISGLVLCPSGKGTSLILLKELEELFPYIEFLTESSHENINPVDFDIIFSTTTTKFLLETNTPFIIVNPIMNSKEKFVLIGRVFELINEKPLLDPHCEYVLDIVKKHVKRDEYSKIETEVIMTSGKFNSKALLEDRGDYPLLSDITSPELIKLNVRASNWEEAIRKSTEVLVAEGKVLSSYIDGMIQTTKESGPYIVITKHVALPHARPESGAKEIAISIATLETPVVFGNKENDPVKYIFGLSALDNLTHLTAMAELAELLDQEQFYEVLDTAECQSDIINYILDFESEA